MRLVQTIILAGVSFFLSAGIGYAADLGDLDLTIRVIETDDVQQIHNELSLPAIAAEAAHEPAGGGLTQAAASRKPEEKQQTGEQETAAGQANGLREEEHEVHLDRDEHIEDRDDREDEHQEARETENLEDDHEKEHNSEQLTVRDAQI